ncbi:MAG: hypothetical protein PVF45_04540 [Anaerolineae bacterium]|jgi:hypothetical protein
MSQTNKTTGPLAGLEETIRRHWQTHRPGMCADLEARGELEGAIRQAAENTRGAVAQLTGEGMHFLEAWESVREEWAILPAEEDADVDDPALRDAMRAVLGFGDEDEAWDEGG